MESRRLLSATLDPSFNGNGVNIFDTGSSADSGRVVVTLPNEQVLMISSNENGVGVTRYTTGGGLDTTLDGDGYQVTTINSNTAAFHLADIRAAAVMGPANDYRVIIVGSDVSGANVGEGQNVGVVALQLNGLGGYDVDWTSSVDLESTGTNEFGTGVVIQGSGIATRVLVSATTQSGTDLLGAVIGLDQNGVEDISFGGGDGIVLSSDGSPALLANTSAVGIALQPNGRIVVAANTFQADVTTHQPAVLGFTANGALDPTFGSGGAHMLGIVAEGPRFAFAIATASDNSIILGGEAWTDVSVNFLLARVSANGTSHETFAQPAPGVFNMIRDVAVLPNGDALAVAHLIVLDDPEDLMSNVHDEYALVRYSLGADPVYSATVSPLVIGGAQTAGYIGHPDPGLSLTLQTDGSSLRAVIGGTILTDDFADSDLLVAGFTLDPTPLAGPISVPSFLVHGFESGEFSVPFNDAAPPDATVEWDFGDGNTASGATATNTYAATGTYTVTATVTDNYHVTVRTTNVTVGNAGVDGDGNLIVNGSNGSDVFAITPAAGGNVRVNGQLFAPPQDIIIFGGLGADIIAVGGGVQRSVFIFAGAGNDLVTGGGGNDVIVGGDGNDLVLGGAGRDLLIGGDGADAIMGNTDDDIIIAGYTSHDDDIAALKDIMAEWQSNTLFASRVANLQAGGGMNGTVVLNANTTVSDDGDADMLTGNGGQDWFLFNADTGVRDRVLDMTSFEAQHATDLDQIAIV